MVIGAHLLHSSLARAPSGQRKSALEQGELSTALTALFMTGNILNLKARYIFITNLQKEAFFSSLQAYINYHTTA